MWVCIFSKMGGGAILAQPCMFFQSTFAKAEKPLYSKKAILEGNYMQMWKRSFEAPHLIFMHAFHKSLHIQGRGTSHAVILWCHTHRAGIWWGTAHLLHLLSFSIQQPALSNSNITSPIVSNTPTPLSSPHRPPPQPCAWTSTRSDALGSSPSPTYSLLHSKSDH